MTAPERDAAKASDLPGPIARGGHLDEEDLAPRTSEHGVDLIELIDEVERLYPDRPTAWAAAEAEMDRRRTQQREWGSQDQDTAAAAQEPGRRPQSAQSSGGAMPIHADPVAGPRRPFTGFDRERATYERHRDQLLRSYAGKYVVIVGEEVEGFLDTFEEALRAGYRRFGLGPLYVKQVLAEEPVVEVTRDIRSCHS